ncbi:ATP-dependent DNA ligase [Paenibacillus sp. FJAT-27812]|uniref:ATP-dependent DNA ligase n=1 Tax=Paenibacillus sp. FJAT-27812 TaxID=1684143 RepID=UPI0006A77072|nr:RNA ligase family protein [Paenibacillus sp. FJAT-27812]
MFMKPMLMTRYEKPFDDENYIFEPIIDGHRLQLSFMSSKTKLYTRHFNEVTRQYPELHNVPLREPADVVLDGEVAYVNPHTGAIEFDTLQKRFRLKKEPSIRDAKRINPVEFFVFDILYYNGVDLRETPLLERKRLLDAILEDNLYYKKMLFVEREGMALFDLVKRSDLEGVACKRKDSTYAEGRGDNWLKVKNDEYGVLPMTEMRNEVSNAEQKSC